MAKAQGHFNEGSHEVIRPSLLLPPTSWSSCDSDVPRQRTSSQTPSNKTLQRVDAAMAGCDTCHCGVSMRKVASLSHVLKAGLPFRFISGLLCLSGPRNTRWDIS